ncbi:BTB domain-containing protein [Mycena venus]|uniref:BTB domain-containing protein n=1 Tax=Mycena venus TaxID=2733690 RepID=A0A8H6U3X6_9AGAR|nr:BTB domain-containing protein [Mycena venus]
MTCSDCLNRRMRQLWTAAPWFTFFDHGRDVEYFLKALIDYKFFLAFPSPTTFDIVTGIIRLSKKYEVDSLYKRALVHFASAFPMTVADYPICPSWDPTDEYIRALTFARELELDWALPTALYRVCAYTAIEDILNGIRVDNRWLELDPQDKLVCLQQSVELRGSASASILDFLWDPEKIEGCRNYNSTCKDERLRLRKLAEDWRTKNLPLVLWTDEEWSLCNACSTCLNVMKATHQASLEKFWDSLPQRFGLGTWDDLRERKSIALGS